jgi:hypothetical protein
LSKHVESKLSSNVATLRQDFVGLFCTTGATDTDDELLPLLSCRLRDPWRFRDFCRLIRLLHVLLVLVNVSSMTRDLQRVTAHRNAKVSKVLPLNVLSRRIVFAALFPWNFSHRYSRTYCTRYICIIYRTPLER